MVECIASRNPCDKHPTQVAYRYVGQRALGLYRLRASTSTPRDRQILSQCALSLGNRQVDFIAADPSCNIISACSPGFTELSVGLQGGILRTEVFFATVVATAALEAKGGERALFGRARCCFYRQGVSVQGKVCSARPRPPQRNLLLVTDQTHRFLVDSLYASIFIAREPCGTREGATYLRLASASATQLLCVTTYCLSGRSSRMRCIQPRSRTPRKVSQSVSPEVWSLEYGWGATIFVSGCPRGLSRQAPLLPGLLSDSLRSPIPQNEVHSRVWVGESTTAIARAP